MVEIYFVAMQYCGRKIVAMQAVWAIIGAPENQMDRFQS